MDDKQSSELKQAFKRVFSLPITKSTFKEIQTTLYNLSNQDADKANTILEALLSGEAKDKELRKFIEEYGIQTRLSKDILEKGEFINFMSSDLLVQGNQALFNNYIRRVDGDHFQFFSEPEGIFRLIEHFTGRLEEISRADKSQTFLKTHNEDLDKLKKRFENLAV